MSFLHCYDCWTKKLHRSLETPVPRFCLSVSVIDYNTADRMYSELYPYSFLHVPIIYELSVFYYPSGEYLSWTFMQYLLYDSGRRYQPNQIQ